MTEQTLSKRQRKAAEIARAREWLAEQFPAVFGGKGGVPIAIGGHQQAHDAAKAEGGPPSWAIQGALRKWTRHPAYLEALTTGATRYNLDGTPGGAVTAKQAEKAAHQLAEFRRRWKAEKAAKAKSGAKRPVLTLKKGAKQ